MPVSAVDETVESQGDDNQTMEDIANDAANIKKDQRDGIGKGNQQGVKKYNTNTTKAVVAMNLYAVFTVVFIQLNKVIVNQQKTQVMDLIFFMNLFNVLIAGPLIALKSDLSFIVP